MKKGQLVDTYHEEIIHDVAFNYYGNRFATVSTDQSIRVYGKDNNGQWIRESEQKCHDGPIWKIRWAHPKYGSILATCSQDKSVSIWEEKRLLEEEAKKLNLKSQWVQRTLILETKEGVTDIQFGCKQHGLQLAIAFTDGKLQIHKILEQNHFLISADEAKAMPYGIRCISWNTSPVETEMIAVGANNQQSRYKLNQNSQLQSSNNVLPSQDMPPLTGTLIIFQKQERSAQDQQFKLVPIYDFQTKETISDVSWANQNARSFHLLATADKNGLSIYKFKFINNKIEQVVSMTITYQYKYFRQNENIEAHRLSWNILANMIAVTYTKQIVKVYQLNNNSWVSQGTFTENQLCEPINL